MCPLITTSPTVIIIQNGRYVSFLPDVSKTPDSHATLPLSVVSGLYLLRISVLTLSK